MIKNEESKIEKILTVVGFVICFVVALFFITKGGKIDANIEQNKFLTVGKIYEYTRVRGSHNYDYFYYYKGIKYKNSYYIGRGQESKSKTKFYILKLSTEHPEYSEIDLDQEVTDTVAILKAGFTKEEILATPSSAKCSK